MRESVRPVNNSGIVWHALATKTIELIHVVGVEDDLVVDADLIEVILDALNPKRKAKVLKLAARLRRRTENPLFRPLSERLKQI